jgi:hypothetical protein
MNSLTFVGSGGAGTSRQLPNCIELELPARPELFFLARMAAAAVGSRADFGYDQIDDLRLAIDEMLLILLGGRAHDVRVHLVFEWMEDAVAVVATLRGEEAPGEVATEDGPALNGNLSAMSERILDALVDEHGTLRADGVAKSTLRVRRRTQ